MKWFPEGMSQLTELYRALGQYTVYYHALKQRGLEDALYLAVPHDIYTAFLREPEIAEAMHPVAFRYILCDIDNEEVVEWIR